MAFRSKPNDNAHARSIEYDAHGFAIRNGVYSYIELSAVNCARNRYGRSRGRDTNLYYVAIAQWDFMALWGVGGIFACVDTYVADGWE